MLQYNFFFILFINVDEEEPEGADSPDVPDDEQEVTYTIGIEVQFFNSRMARWLISWNQPFFRAVGGGGAGLLPGFQNWVSKNTHLGWIGCPIPFHPIAWYTKNMDIRVSQISNNANEQIEFYKSFPFIVWLKSKIILPVWNVSYCVHENRSLEKYLLIAV